MWVRFERARGSKPRGHRGRRQKWVKRKGNQKLLGVVYSGVGLEELDHRGLDLRLGPPGSDLRGWIGT